MIGRDVRKSLSDWPVGGPLFPKLRAGGSVPSRRRAWARRLRRGMKIYPISSKRPFNPRSGHGAGLRPPVGTLSAAEGMREMIPSLVSGRALRAALLSSQSAAILSLGAWGQQWGQQQELGQ